MTRLSSFARHLRAFEAAARHLSMTLAARELNVTPGAVSLQIRDLEASLGVKLFERKTRALALTVEGADYFSTLRAAFRSSPGSDGGNHDAGTRRRPQCYLHGGLCDHWLRAAARPLRGDAPRNRRPHQRISPRPRFSARRIDLAIRHGLGGYDGLISERLVDDELVPVCTPRLAGPARRQSLARRSRRFPS